MGTNIQHFLNFLKKQGIFLQNPLFLYKKFKFYFYLGLFLLFQVGVAVKS